MFVNRVVTAVGTREAKPLLKNMLNGYMSQWARIYIGATAHPKMRYEQHMLDGWRKMVIVYEAFLPEIARSMEQALIAHARESNFLTLVVNTTPGGEGLSTARRSNYLYVLCG